MSLKAQSLMTALMAGAFVSAWYRRPALVLIFGGGALFVICASLILSWRAQNNGK